MSDETSITSTDCGWKVVLNVDGAEVSGLSIVDQRVRVGSAGLKMAGIAGYGRARIIAGKATQAG